MFSISSDAKMTGFNLKSLSQESYEDDRAKKINNSEFTQSLEFVPSVSLKLAERRFLHLDRVINEKNTSSHNLERAYRSCFQIATRHLYNIFRDLKGDVSLLVQNGGDGFGDHAHGVSVSNQILLDFPNVTVGLYTFFQQKLNSLPSLAKPDSSRASCHFSSEYYADDNEASTELKKKIHQSSCVMDISFDTGRMDLELEAVRQGPKYSYLREYGCGHPSDSDPAHALSMGLTDLEEGVFIKDIPHRPLALLKNERIKNILFGTENPTIEALEKYQKEHHMHLFYHKLDCFYQASDIYIVADLHQDDNKMIDIMLPMESSLEWLVHWNILDKGVLESFGVGQIRLIKKDSNELLQISESGKEIRIIHPAFLPQEDFYTLLSNCEEPFGATGDHTFTDGLSKGLVIYYELRSVKEKLFSSWIKLSESLGCPLVNSYLENVKESYNSRTENFKSKLSEQNFYYDNYMTNFIRGMAPKVTSSSHAIAQLMQDPEFRNQWIKVNGYIRQNCDVKYNLKDIVARHLAFHHFPDLAKVEEECYSAFRKGEKSIRVLNSELSLAIEEYRVK